MNQDLNRYFQIEAEDLLSRITAALERLRSEPLGEELLRELRRWAHTLKGAAQVVRRDDIAAGAHRLENAVDDLANAAEPGPTLERACAVTAELSGYLRPPQKAPEQAAAAPEQEIETLRIELRDLDDVLHTVNESVIVASGLGAAAAPLERARELARMLRGEFGHESRDRRLHHAIALADEMQDITETARREMDLAAERVQRELDTLRAKAERLRLVRAAVIVQAVQQSVRAAAESLGRQVEFESAGEDLELDAHLLLAARDALIQLARNAVAHGIESPEERIAAGKSPAGRVRLEFRREGFRQVLEISDDGRGIDFEGLRQQAVERGWMTPERAREAGTQELTHFLLQSGVTTASSAGMLAGRGVGLDLVSHAVTRLKGELRISGEPGKGTSVQLRVPASLSSAAVLVVRAGSMAVGLPRDSVRRAASVAMLRRLGDEYVVQGRALPLVPLASVLGSNGSAGASVAVEIESHPAFLLGVEALEGVRSAVIHSLPEHIQAEPWILGASIESEGSLRLIVDPAMLAPQLSQWTSNHADQRSGPAPALPILVIDDSLTTRMLEQSIFETEGYAVDLASSAEEALTMARQRRYGLFLVDVEMPGMDGVAFIERAQQDARLHTVPAVLVTSRGSAEDRARGINAGASDYIVKSEFDQRHLLKRVRELTGRG